MSKPGLLVYFLEVLRKDRQILCTISQSLAKPKGGLVMPKVLRTLPERGFRRRARAVAVLFCAVCLGLAVRLFFLQVRTDGFYADRAQGQQLRDTVVPRRPGAHLQRRRPFAGRQQQLLDPAGLAPGDAGREKIPLAAHGLAEILALDEAALLEKIQRPPLQRLPAPLPGGPCRSRCCAGLLRGKQHHRHPHQSGQQALVSAGSVSGFGAGVHQCGQRRGWPGWS